MIYPEFTVFIPKKREYLAQLRVQSTRKIFGYKKLKGGAKMAIRGVKLTFGGGPKKIWGYKSSRGRKKPIRKIEKNSDLFSFVLETVKHKKCVLCRGAI